MCNHCYFYYDLLLMKSGAIYARKDPEVLRGRNPDVSKTYLVDSQVYNGHPQLRQPHLALSAMWPSLLSGEGGRGHRAASHLFLPRHPVL